MVLYSFSSPETDYPNDIFFQICPRSLYSYAVMVPQTRLFCFRLNLHQLVVENHCIILHYVTSSISEAASNKARISQFKVDFYLKWMNNRAAQTVHSSETLIWELFTVDVCVSGHYNSTLLRGHQCVLCDEPAEPSGRVAWVPGRTPSSIVPVQWSWVPWLGMWD